MNDLLEQLHDIEGVDPVSAWPLAAGWWFLAVSVSIALSGLLAFILRRRAYRRSWKQDALLQLCCLEQDLPEKTVQETAAQLSELMRRIAMRRYSRQACAALHGESWLQWLQSKDPRGFGWKTKGQLLIRAPYAPADARLPKEEVAEMIQAAKRWVR